jgi:uncharacterized glyoxalase superfamily protein PhnB
MAWIAQPASGGRYAPKAECAAWAVTRLSLPAYLTFYPDLPMTATSAVLNATTLGCSITCKDLAASIHFYAEVLGFSVAMTFDRDGKTVGAVIQAGDIRIVLNQDDGALGWDRIKGQGFYLQVNVAGPADVDAAAERIRAAGGTLLNEPEDRPWGARMFQFKDPDGFKLGVSTPLKG